MCACLCPSSELLGYYQLSLRDKESTDLNSPAVSFLSSLLVVHLVSELVLGYQITFIPVNSKSRKPGAKESFNRYPTLYTTKSI